MRLLDARSVGISQFVFDVNKRTLA